VSRIDPHMLELCTAHALAGLASRPIHDVAGPMDRKTGKATVVPGAAADHVAARALELGKATAALLAAEAEAQERAEAEAEEQRRAARRAAKTRGAGTPTAPDAPAAEPGPETPPEE